MKRCRDCGCLMSDDHYGNICECCLDDRVPEKELTSDDDYIRKIVKYRGVTKDNDSDDLDL